MKKLLFFLFFVLILSVKIFPQSVGITDFMRLNPYSNFNNPASFTPYNWYVGIPGASYLNFSYYNSGFTIDKLLKMNNKNTPMDVYINKSLKDLTSKNWINTNMGLELLGFGFRLKELQKFFFTFSYQLKMDQQLSYSKDLFGLLLQSFLAKNEFDKYLYSKTTPAHLDLGGNFSLYQEFSIGVQCQVIDKLYIGVRPKFLFGLFNLKANHFETRMYSDPTNGAFYGKFNVDIDLTSVIPFVAKDQKGVSLSSHGIKNINFANAWGKSFSQNAGFAIDFGAVYRINKELRVSVSVTDLGFIRWKSTPLNMSLKSVGNADILLNNVSEELISDLIKKGINISLDSMITIANTNFAMKRMDAFTTMITSKFMADCYFDLTPHNRFIAQFKGYLVGNKFLPQFTVAYNGTFFDAIDVVVSYSMMKNSFANLGVGAGFRIGPLHLYVGTDNIIVAKKLFNTTKVNLTAGLLLDFPLKVSHKETELNSIFKKRESQ